MAFFALHEMLKLDTIIELYVFRGCRYDNGLVSRLESDISDPFWSVNIKRAILNLLHVSLRQERQITDISPEDFAETTDFTLRNVINRDRSFDKIFKVKEVCDVDTHFKYLQTLTAYDHDYSYIKYY